MRAAIGLVGLSLIGGVAPTGLAGFAYAAPVLAGTAGALVLLAAGCLAGASLSRRRARPAASAAREFRWAVSLRPTPPLASSSASSLSRPMTSRALGEARARSQKVATRVPRRADTDGTRFNVLPPGTDSRHGGPR